MTPSQGDLTRAHAYFQSFTPPIASTGTERAGGATAERAAIVAWLRERAAEKDMGDWGPSSCASDGLNEAADRIEAEAHWAERGV